MANFSKSTRIRLFLLQWTMVLTSTVNANALAATDNIDFKTASHDGLAYRYHEPTLKKGASAPLVVFLHGAGERGGDNKAQIDYAFFKTSGSLFLAEPMFILAPQVPSTEKWIAVEKWGQPTFSFSPQPTPAMAKLVSLINRWRTQPGVDSTRIYVTGMSMGGYGTYDLLARKPQWFAAAVVVCGRGDPATAAIMKKVPFYIVHGAKDPLITPALAQPMVEALRQVGAKVTYVEYPGVGHDSWNKAYTDQAVRAWLFAQKSES